MLGTLLIVGFGSPLVNRARRDLVGLDFTEAGVAKVVRAMGRQTRETIFVQPGVTNKITIRVYDAPLGQALEIVSAQAECALTAVFAVYRHRSSLRQLENRLVTGKAEPGIWTNYPALSIWRSDFPFAEGTGDLINYAVAKREAARVARDLSRFGTAVVVLEDGLSGPAQLRLKEASIEVAVQALAQALDAKVARYYVLRPYTRDEERPAMPLAPAAEQLKLQQKMVDEIRQTTPEQRLERLRQTHGNP